jgi:hypothetical protein
MEFTELFSDLTWPEIVQRLAILVTIGHIALKITLARINHERNSISSDPERHGREGKAGD